MEEGGGVPIREANTGLENAAPIAGMSLKECTDRIRKALSHPTVKFLRQHMEKAGCPVWTRLLMAVNCKEQNFAGGYSSQNGVSICCNRMTFQDEINQVIIHELIHAFDDCRVKNMDWKNCAHHACSEEFVIFLSQGMLNYRQKGINKLSESHAGGKIRANHLSGDCHYKRELLRGFMKIRGHEQECVKRRALKSVAINPHCSEAAAKDAIEAVWDICYNDTYPFDRAP